MASLQVIWPTSFESKAKAAGETINPHATAQLKNFNMDNLRKTHYMRRVTFCLEKFGLGMLVAIARHCTFKEEPGVGKLRLFSRWAVWIGLFFILKGAAAEQPHSKQQSATKLCEHLLATSMIPDDFEGNPLFMASAPGVFQIIGSEIQESEISTLRLLVERFGGRALAIGNFGHMKGLPAVDAVYFPKTGEPINLSIKTIQLSKSTNGIRGFRKHAGDAEMSILKYFSREAYAHALGLQFDEDGLHAAPGTNHQRYRMRTAEALFRILGLDQEKPRAAGILMDISIEERQRPTLIHVDKEDPEHGRLVGDSLLRIVDERVDEDSIEFPAVMNLSQMIRRMHDGGSVRKFIALFAGASVVVDSSGLRYHLQN